MFKLLNFNLIIKRKLLSPTFSEKLSSMKKIFIIGLLSALFVVIIFGAILPSTEGKEKRIA